jgi:hypothetical protein
MIIFETDTDSGFARDIFWLGNTILTDCDEYEQDGIYEQLLAHEIFLDE